MVKKVAFDKPPVVEVACGAGFDLSQRLTAGHIGLFWQTVESEFPNIDEVSPLPPPQRPDAVTIELSNLPPLARTWLSSEDGSRLMQLQGDRFIYNWKRQEDDDQYPSFDMVYKEFQECLGRFLKFLEHYKISKPDFRYLELQYVNHIGNSNGLQDVGKAGVLVDHTRLESKDRFLPAPTAYNWQSQYPMPDDTGLLTITAQTAISRATGGELLRLDMSTRGSPKEDTAESFDKWFELAHDWIVQGFCDITVPELHKIWMRTR